MGWMLSLRGSMAGRCKGEMKGVAAVDGWTEVAGDIGKVRRRGRGIRFIA